MIEKIDWNITINIITTTISLVALFIAFRQARKASQQAEASIKADALFKLYDLYASKEMHDDIKRVWEAIATYHTFGTWSQFWWKKARSKSKKCSSGSAPQT